MGSIKGGFISEGEFTIKTPENTAYTTLLDLVHKLKMNEDAHVGFPIESRRLRNGSLMYTVNIIVPDEKGIS